MSLQGRNLLKVTDLTAGEFLDLVELAGRLRLQKRMGVRYSRLAGRNIALIFEETCTRTRSAFEVAAHDEGAHVTYLEPADSQLDRGEPVKDTARALGRMFDGIGYRGAAQVTAETLGGYAGVPVWNGRTDEWHPTQMLADLMTMRDNTRKRLTAVSCCYLGDGRTNVANSLLVTGAMLGMDVRICAPAPLQPSARIQEIAGKLAADSGARLELTGNVRTAVRGADFVYTNAWLSEGEPLAAWDERIDLLLPYQVNQRVMAATWNPAVKFMHCLPARHNRDTEVGQRLYERRGLEALEVTEEVFESPASIVFEQADNRLHTIKAVMLATVGDLR
jgi:ornithine carbamoyltransferase